MKILDDKILEQSAKRIVGQIDEQGEKMLSADKCEKTYFSDIKVAKAKAGARRHINRTIRICAVAAVLMVGLVCALFMGADEVELPPAPDPINIDKTFDAYMWKNNSTDPAENMPVKVRIWMEETSVLRINNPKDEPEYYDPLRGEHGTVWGRSYSVAITVSDLEGNEIATYTGPRFRKQDAVNTNSISSGLPANYVPYVSDNTELPVEFKYTEFPEKYYDDELKKYVWKQETPIKYIQLEMNEDFTNFEIFISYEAEHPENEEGLESFFVAENQAMGRTSDSYVWSHENAIFITCGATTREEAIARRYEIAEEKAETITERTGRTTGFLFDRINSKVWK